MNPDTIAILISGAAGVFVGALFATAAMAALAGRASTRAAKAAWAAANLYYTRKEAER